MEMMSKHSSSGMTRCGEERGIADILPKGTIPVKKFLLSIAPSVVDNCKCKVPVNLR